jgi:GxxExxY protein
VPIECLFKVKPVSKSRFHAIDYQVMRAIFDSHNELGRLYHESLYQSEVAEKCSRAGMNVVSEGEVRLTLQDFQKSYYLDALIEYGALYEFKAVDRLHERHDAQLLNYLFLAGLSEGKLINFASPSVQHRFVSTTVSPEDRFVFSLDAASLNKESHHIVDIVNSILKEWGCFLDVHLYEEAIVHFLGGQKKVRKPVNIIHEGRLVGKHPMCLVDEMTGIHISSVVKGIDQYRKHLERMLLHTDLKHMVWVNFSRNKVQFKSLVNCPVIK